MFMMPLHPPARPMSDMLAEDIEKTLLADRLGFDEFWLGEHFSASSEPYASAMMFMASLVPRTTNLKFGTGVVNLPNHHPAVVAAEVAQFDHMSGGRFLFGIGPGGLASDFELFGATDFLARGRKMIESIDMIEKIWSSDPPYELQGEFWNFGIKNAIVPSLGIGTMLKPLQKPTPPISITLASPFSGLAKLAEQRGWDCISANISPVYSVASHWKTYADACAASGKAPDGKRWRVVRNVLVAPSDREARDRVFGETASNRYFFTYMHEIFGGQGLLKLIKPRAEMTDAETTPEALLEEGVIYGSPKTMLDKLIAFRERVGPFGTLIMGALDWSGPNEAWERESMRLLAEDVMPKFRQHIAQQ